ncbi:lipopolysaccharide kinase InaA family protein [Akkermansiaceae bacterium]|nr:lipopolysaccharide kinase InaA family protein [Akkermansiaceae bacterium]
MATEEEGLISSGRHRVAVLSFKRGDDVVKIAVKAFGKQGRWKDGFDEKRGSKAARSFEAARFLAEKGVGTPEPIGYMDLWKGAVLLESFYFSAYVEGLSSFKDELVKIYQERPKCDRLVRILRHVAPEIRKMHDAGFLHRDLGNQNIELEPPQGKSEWGEVHFIDLNRGRMKESLGMEERAQDFSRIRVPGVFLDIMVKLYWQKVPPADFLRIMKKSRARFLLWEKTRKWRRPFRKAQKGPGLLGMQSRDVWIWDDKTAQASVILSREERKQAHSRTKYIHLAKAVLGAGWSVWNQYQELLPQAFTKKISLKGRIGMSLEMADLDVGKQVEFLDELGRIPVLLRFCHHEGRAQWEEPLRDMEMLHAQGHAIRVAVI